MIAPKDVIDRYGADALRLFLYTLNAPGDYKNFDMNAVDQIFKKNFLILWNVYTFYATFADDLLRSSTLSRHVMDRWVLSQFELLKKEVTERLNRYDIFMAGRALQDFIQELSTWYVRRSRDRFKSEDAGVKTEALNTLHTVLFELSQLMAPFTPFFAEELFFKVKDKGDITESVHLCDWPVYNEERVESDIVSSMHAVRSAVSIALEKRAESKIPVRQILSELVVSSPNDLSLYEDIFSQEVNVQKVSFARGEKLEVVLKTEITEELRELGLVREITRHVNALRKMQD